MNEVSEPRHEGEATPSESLSTVLDTTDVASADEPLSDNSHPDLPIPRWLFSLIGHVLAAMLGLVLGYLILSLLRPLTFPVWW